MTAIVPRLLLLSAAALLGCRQAASAAAPEPPAVSSARPPASPPADGGPTQVDNFVLFDQDDRAHELERDADASAIVLVSHGIGCPIVRQQTPVLQELAAKLADQGVVFYLVNSNPEDDRDALRAEAEEYGITIPILRDDTQVVGRDLGFERMADAVLIDPRTWRIVYRGLVDDRLDYGTQRREASRHYLAEAIDELLDGGPVEVESTEPRGCLIYYEPQLAGGAEPASYAEEVAPILLQKCVVCHQKGQVGPFELDSYRSARRWSPMIREVLKTRRMPPWFADPDVGHLEDERALTPGQFRTLVSWIDAGSPRGEGPDPLAEHEPEPVSEWPFGEPDLVVSMPGDYPVPATGVVDYVFLGVDSGLTEDKWVRAAVLEPGNRKVVHHAFVFLRYPVEKLDQQPDWRVGVNSYFALYAPGQQIEPLPEDTGLYLPANTRFTFQMHYVTTGREETDRSVLGLYFCDEKPAHELKIESAWDDEFVVPAGARAYPVTAEKTFDEEVILYDMFPHMHYRGSSMVFEAILPDGSSETLLSVPNYDFNWQLRYTLAEPRRFPAGTRIRCSGTFDNSAANPLNPDPTVPVGFGLQSFEEMFIGYLSFSPVGGN